MNVGFCCRSGRDIGYGHLSRSVNLARGFVAADYPVRFYHRGAWPAFIAIDIEGCESLSELLDWSDVVVFDGIDRSEVANARVVNPRSLLVQVDDIGEPCEAADVILNPNLYGATLDYPGEKRVLAGPKYNLVAPQLFDQDRSQLAREKLLISFGGSDLGQYGIPTASALATRHSAVTLFLACDKQQCDEGAVDALQRAGITVLFQQRVADLLPDCRVYIGAAGVTAVEALAAGCRLAVCSIVDNQRPNVAALQQAGYPAFDGFDAERLAGAALREWNNPVPGTSLIAASGIPRIVTELQKQWQRRAEQLQ